MLLYLCFVILYSVSASRYELRNDTTLDYILEELQNLKSKQASCDSKAFTLEELVSQLQQRNDKLEKEVSRLGQLLQQEEKNIQTRNPKQMEQTINQPHIVTKHDTEDKLTPNVRNKRQVSGQVAFTVGVSMADIEHLGDHHTIVFDKAITNIGNTYNTNTGIFLVPLKGAYVFTLTLMVIARHSEYLEIVADGTAFASDIFADASSVDDYMSNTKQWILDLNKGSQVWIRTSSYGNNQEIHGNMHTLFNGFLLFETE